SKTGRSMTVKTSSMPPVTLQAMQSFDCLISVRVVFPNVTSKGRAVLIRSVTWRAKSDECRSAIAQDRHAVINGHTAEPVDGTIISPNTRRGPHQMTYKVHSDTHRVFALIYPRP